MFRSMMKSKIHRATVTDANLKYVGSITIDKNLCEKADILENERVDVVNCNNGSRFSTYVIYGKKDEICINGAAARLAQPGDVVIIISYGTYQDDELKEHKPNIVFID
ncbi:MAG: aspartate 1-decarboxylase [Bacteriovoracaceae bacterium]|nr:aspartate 1-decarboxylase [Bacteriovoracaceae bacterium]